MRLTMAQAANEERFPINNSLIRQLRHERRLSQEEVAHKLGISAKTLAMFENGSYDSISSHDRINRCRNLDDIAKFYGRSGWKSLIRLAEQAGGSGVSGSKESRLAPPGCSASPSEPAAFHPPLASVDAGQFPLLPDLPYDPATYGHRVRAESEAMSRLRHAGLPLIIQAPEGYGKTTFVSWLLDKGTCGLPKHRAVRVKLSALDQALLTDLERFLAHLGERLIRAVAPDTAEAVLAEAQARPGGAKERLRWLLGEHIISGDTMLVWILERADRLWGNMIQDDFFSLLRDLMEEEDSTFARLRLVITVATEPTLLDTLDHSGFFSRTQPLVLTDLDDEEVRLLALHHRHTLTPADLELIRFWLGGQPALLRLAFYQAAQGGRSIRELLEDVDLRAATFRGHLLRLHRWLESHPHLRELLSALILNPSQILFPEDYGLFYSKALLREKDSGLRLRCRLYEDYFSKVLQPGRDPRS